MFPYNSTSSVNWYNLPKEQIVNNIRNLKKKSLLSPGPSIIFLNINIKERLMDVNKRFKRQRLLNGYFLKRGK